MSHPFGLPLPRSTTASTPKTFYRFDPYSTTCSKVPHVAPRAQVVPPTASATVITPELLAPQPAAPRQMETVHVPQPDPNQQPRDSVTVMCDRPADDTALLRRHDPDTQVLSQRPLCEALPSRIYRLLLPPDAPDQRRTKQRRGTSCNKQKEIAALGQFLHGPTCVTYHSFESIDQNAVYEEEVLGLASPFQPKAALINLRGSHWIKHGIHLGQFLSHTCYAKENFLTLRVLVDLTGVTFYECDFDHNKCCRIFLDGEQSLERVLAFSKRIRTTTFGVFVAHTEAAALDLEKVHFGGRIPNVPYHSIPIELMRTSREATAMFPQQQQEQQQQPQYRRPGGAVTNMAALRFAPPFVPSSPQHRGGGGREAM